MIHVTTHAILRYQERVAAVTAEVAGAALSSPMVERAVRFGAPLVRLGGGQRIVLHGPRVVTVLPRGHWPGSFDPRRDGLHD